MLRVNACLRSNSNPAEPNQVPSGEVTDVFIVVRALGVYAERKKFWLLPIIVVMLLFGALMVFAQSSALAPFIYTIF